MIIFNNCMPLNFFTLHALELFLHFQVKEVKKGAAIIELPVNQYIPITGDVKVEFFRKTMRKVSKEIVGVVTALASA